MAGKLTRWFEDRIAEIKQQATQAPNKRCHLGEWRPSGQVMAELEVLRDEAQALEGDRDDDWRR